MVSIWKYIFQPQKDETLTFLTAEVHRESKFLTISGLCHTMDVAEVIHREAEWELAAIV